MENKDNPQYIEKVKEAFNGLDTQSTVPEIAKELNISIEEANTIVGKALENKMIKDYGIVMCNVTGRCLIAYEYPEESVHAK